MCLTWLALGPGTTWSQKMQGAFAAELLAPMEGMRGLQHDLRRLDREEAERLANYYAVLQD